jgi:hypothetical protein
MKSVEVNFFIFIYCVFFRFNQAHGDWRNAFQRNMAEILVKTKRMEHQDLPIAQLKGIMVTNKQVVAGRLET